MSSQIFTPLAPELALRAVAWLLAASVCVTSAELGLLLARGQLGAGSLFDWRILRLRRTVVGHPILLGPLDAIFARRLPTALWLLVGPATAIASAIGFGGDGGLFAAILLVAFALTMALRFPIGRDGADQLSLFLCLAILGYQLAPSTEAARFMLLAICAQLTDSYAVSGLSKLTAIAWRRGDALHAVLRTSCYGNPVVAARLNARTAYLIGLATAMFEAAYPLVWVLDGRVALAFLAAGITFHCGVWLIMGLNSFFITFVAGYPALLWLIG